MSSCPALPERSLGTQGFKGSAQGYGCMSLTDFHGPNTAEGAEATLRHVLDSGVTVLNTADLYDPNINQELIGRVIQAYPRERIKITSKIGPMWKDGSIQLDLSRKAIRAACEGSLQRLGVDYIDILVLRGSGRDPNTPLEETMAEMKALVQEGKALYLGLSEFSAADIRRAHAVHPITALEMEWSLFSRDAEEDLVPTARELGIGFLAYSPLGRGVLTGALKSREDFSAMAAHNPRVQGDNFDKNMALVNRFVALAHKKGCTPGQLALAWVQARGPDVIPIPGTKRPACVTENLGALEVHLSPEELQEMEEAVPHHEVAGDRYPNMQKTSYHYDK